MSIYFSNFAAEFMKRIASILFLAGLCAVTALADDRPKPGFQIEDNTFFDPSKKEVKEENYVFHVDYRLEVGFTQHWQRPHSISYPEIYLHGARMGATFTFALPKHFDITTGVLYTLVFGRNDQHWRSMDAPSTQTEYVHHRVLEHNMTIPVRMYYTIPLWKQLNLFFFTGPQLHIGLAENDYLQTHLSDGTKAWLETIGVATEPYDRMTNEIVRANIQWGVGGGLEWDRYRLQSGYDFGLNNLVRHPKTKGQYMSEWGWFVSFCYRF